MRGSDFTMKALYTFDATQDAALKTYRKVQSAYKVLLEIGLPYIHVRSVLLSSSLGHFLTIEKRRGRIRKYGGSLSHEYHSPLPWWRVLLSRARISPTVPTTKLLK